MILELSADASPISRFAAATILYVHIGAGLVALASGAVAAIAKKGATVHRSAGNVFFASMLVMASIGAAVSPFLDPPQWTNVIAGLFTLYLVVTGYLSGGRKSETSLVRKLTFATAVTIAIGAFGVAMNAAETSDAGPAYMFAVIATLAAIGDFRMLMRGALPSTHHVARHLWRMSYAFAIAAASLFLGQPQVFPEAVRGVLFVPVIAVLVFMLFWIIRMRLFVRKPLIA